MACGSSFHAKTHNPTFKQILEIFTKKSRKQHLPSKPDAAFSWPFSERTRKEIMASIRIYVNNDGNTSKRTFSFPSDLTRIRKSTDTARAIVPNATHEEIRYRAVPIFSHDTLVVADSGQYEQERYRSDTVEDSGEPSALIGSSPTKFIPSPTKVARMMTI